MEYGLNPSHTSFCLFEKGEILIVMSFHSMKFLAEKKTPWKFLVWSRKPLTAIVISPFNLQVLARGRYIFAPSIDQGLINISVRSIHVLKRYQLGCELTGIPII